MMKKKLKILTIALLVVAVLVLTTLYLLKQDIAILNPKGAIALKERKLLIIASLLMLIVVVPVLFFTLFFTFRYKEGSNKGKYLPDWAHSHVAETIWWGVPFAIIVVLAIITWKSSHELDPFKPIVSDKKPMTIQVVALQWKWLFIYPEEKIACVNFVQFPEHTPIVFEITADAPMNSFWIPELGGQIYAMPAMATKLHLIANETGDFRGVSANLSGTGFAGMTFTARASSQEEYQKWVESVKGSGKTLGQESYKTLASPSSYDPVSTYGLVEPNLFDQIVMKYNMP